MANNCLVTKLKSVVNNDNLKYFDAVKITVDFGAAGGPSNLIIHATTISVFLGGVGCIYKPLNNCNVKNGFGDIIETDGQYTLKGSENFTVQIVPIDAAKSADFLIIGLSKITKLTRKINSFTYCDYLDSIGVIASQLVCESGENLILGPKDIFDGSYIKDLQNKSAVTSFTTCVGVTARYSTSDIVGFTSLTSCNPYSGDLSYLSGNTALSAINANSTALTGNISSLGALTSLNTLLIFGTTIQGSIEDFVAAQVTAGRTSGQIKQFNSNGIITFGGNPVSAGHHSITWTSASDITVGDEYIP